MGTYRGGASTRRTVFLRVCVVCFLSMLILACSKDRGRDETASGKAGDAASVLAKVGKSPITVSDLKANLADKPMRHTLQVSEEDLKKRLDEVILEEVLYQEALRLKLDQDPEIRKRMRQMLTQKLMDEKIQKEVWGREIGEKELQKYYDKHWDEFNRAEQVRLADIYLALPADATDEQKAEIKRKAEEVLAKAQEAKGDRFGFGRLMREYSDKHEKYRKGDTGYFDSEGKPLGLDQGLTGAAFALEKVGDMADRVIESPDGYHVIMLVSKRSGVERTLEDVKTDLERRIRREQLTRVRTEYLEGLKKKAGIQVDEKAVAGLAGEMEKEAQARVPLRTEKVPPPRAPGGRSSGPPPFPRAHD